MMETLTQQLYDQANKLITEVQEMGGMQKAIEKGMPQYKIEESAAKRQARIDSGTEVIVGVNKYKSQVADKVEARFIDNSVVREKQIERLNKVKSKRDQAEVKKCLDALTKAAKENNGNLLELSVKAAKARATVGEISDALEVVYGRHQNQKAIVRGAYRQVSTEQSGDQAKLEFEQTVKRIKDFSTKNGRNPRILVAKMGQDGHDRGAKVIASGFADLGFDVDVGAMFSTPEEAARQAIDNDVHVIGVSTLAAGHRTLVPQLKAELAKLGGEHILLVVGGVIPQDDYDLLYKAGANLIFGPGSRIADCANKILDKI